MCLCGECGVCVSERERERIHLWATSQMKNHFKLFYFYINGNFCRISIFFITVASRSRQRSSEKVRCKFFFPKTFRVSNFRVNNFCRKKNSTGKKVLTENFWNSISCHFVKTFNVASFSPMPAA